MSIYTLSSEQSSRLQELLAMYPLISVIAQEIMQKGGTAYLTGGIVRDLVLNRIIKDIDIEVHGISFDELFDLLKKHGDVDVVGKSFGVLKIYGAPIDWSLPRSDKNGRKPEVIINQHLPLKIALERRDLTMNAMALNIHTQEIHDPFHGMDDISEKILRTPHPDFFIEDPLRFFRVMQFIGRFEMEPDNTLNQLCATMSLKGISIERIEEEMKKLLLYSHQPSRGFRWIKSINRLQEIFPELYNLLKIPQDKKWHPEGDVFEHTMQAIDAAASYNYDSDYQKLIVLYAVLCHDLGKVNATVIHDDGRITSYGHEIHSEQLAQQLLKRITSHKDLIKTVSLLARYHMNPGAFVKQNAGPMAYKRLALKLYPYTNILTLGLVSYADRQGRNGIKNIPLQERDPQITEFLTRAEQALVLEKHEEPIIKGRDLMPDIPSGALLGEILKKVYQRQIEKNITSKEILKKYALHLYRNSQKIKKL